MSHPSNISGNLAALRVEATDRLIPEKENADQTQAPASVDFFDVYKMVATESDHAEMEEALTEYDQLLEVSRGLEVAHEAEVAFKKLTNAGIHLPLSGDEFRFLFIARMGPEEQRGYFGRAIDQQIVARLASKAEIVIRRIQAAAIADIDQKLPPPPSADGALARHYGLPVPSPWTPVYRAMHAAKESIRAEMAKPINLWEGVHRRGYMQKHFSKTL